MPIYKYVCESKVKREASSLELCGHEYEVFYKTQSAVEREEPSEACPRCGGVDKRRVFTGEGVSHQFGKGRWFSKDGGY
jgi:predicted nucleic acid-binding Zn ribbon protein